MRGGDRKRVTRGAYEEVFKRAGWEVIQKQKQEVKEESSWDEIDSEEDEEMRSLLEKPISELTNEEVKSLAFYKGIDTEGKSIKQLRELIKKKS